MKFLNQRKHGGVVPNPNGIQNALLLFALLFYFTAHAQTLNLPPRPTDAPTGTVFAQSLIPLAGPASSNNRNFSAREAAICGQILQGNIPNWMRQLTLITTNGIVNGTNYTISYYVTPDYLAIGSDTDYFLTPMTPLLGQYLASKLNCTLPTAKMVNQIWTKAPCKLAPSPIAPSPAMTTVPVFIDHNTTVRGQRFALTNSLPLGTLVGGTKKDVVVSGRIYTAFATSVTKPVVIYGWHQSNGVPIQNVYNGHEETYADYSHGIRLVQMNLTLNGQPNTVTNILTNPNLAAIISNDPYYTANTIPTPRYPTFNPVAPIITTPPTSQTATPGSNVSFHSFAIGDGQLSYQWRRNGTNILNATNTTLTLLNVQTNDAANYSVFVSSSLGSANVTASLSVEPATPVLFESITKATNGAIELTLSGATGQSYVVQASTNLISWRPISVLSITNGSLPFLDLEAINLLSRFYKAGLGATSWLNHFESSATGSGSTFQNPISSGSTSAFLSTNAPTYAYVTNNLPTGNASSKALAVGWTFSPATNAWLRLTTFNAPQLPNPTIAFNQALLFDIYTSNSLYVAVGLRETGTSAAIGADGGTSGSIEWIGTTTTNPPRGRLVPAGEWTTLQFFIPYESVRAFVGNGTLESATGKGVLEHLAFTSLQAGSEHRILLDNFRVVDLSP